MNIVLDLSQEDNKTKQPLQQVRNLAIKKSNIAMKINERQL